MPEVARSTGYDPLRLLRFYAKGEVLTAVHAIVAAAVCAASWVLLTRLIGVARDLALAGALACGSLVLAFDVYILHPFFLHPSLVYMSAFLAVAIALLGVLAGARPIDRRRSRRCSRFSRCRFDIAGTNVPSRNDSPPTYYRSSRCSACSRSSCASARAMAAARRAGRSCCSLRLACSSPAITWSLPTACHRTSSQQRHAVEGLPGVRVDVATKSFLESVAASMREAGFRPGDPVLALDFMPGLVFFLGATSPGFTLYFFDNPRSTA